MRTQSNPRTRRNPAVPHDLSECVPADRLSRVNQADLNPTGRYVIYWMSAFRRTAWNLALERAIELARALRKPLLVVETLSLGERWSSARHFVFVLQGMAENKAVCESHNVRYYPFVELQPGAAIDLVTALADPSCGIVADDYPIDSFTRPITRVADQVHVRLEQVDSNGLLPIRATDRIFPTAHAFRRYLQRVLPDHLPAPPRANPWSRLQLPRLHGLPRMIQRRWPPAAVGLLAAPHAGVASFPIDHAVGPVPTPGGSAAARKVLKHFIEKKRNHYPEDRNHPDADGTSGLSPYLHFGHIAVHQIFQELAKADGWSPARLSDGATGKRSGWWGMSEPVEAFLDQLVTWREIGFNRCCHADRYDTYASLPDWAQTTLAEHAADRRDPVYSPAQFEQARTHDRIWNAAQQQLVQEGRMQNYLRMLWGKKILEWTASPHDALEIMIELNNKFALDGQDPNSYSGIFWVLGRYDRPWGPERRIFGKVRYMSSENTARKLHLRNYLETYAPSGATHGD